MFEEIKYGINAYIRLEAIPPIFPLIPGRHPGLPRIPKHPIFQYINRIYRRGVLSILHRALYAAFSNRLGSPVAEEGLRIRGPEFTVLAVIVTTRAKDVEYLGIDHIFAVLIIQAIDVWPRSGTIISKIGAIDTRKTNPAGAAWRYEGLGIRRLRIFALGPWCIPVEWCISIWWTIVAEDSPTLWMPVPRRRNASTGLPFPRGARALMRVQREPTCVSVSKKLAAQAPHVVLWRGRLLIVFPHLLLQGPFSWTCPSLLSGRGAIKQLL